VGNQSTVGVSEVRAPVAGRRRRRFTLTFICIMARILLIDDDDAVRAMLSFALGYYGHTVTEARNGKEGLELFARTEIDLVVTDIVMPEMEGLAVLMELRKKQPPVKIIAMSGGARDGAGDYLHVAKLMGAGRVLAKPFPTEVLLEAIKELLPTDRAAPRTAPSV
jgi:CheY-like chemotaxis protein